MTYTNKQKADVLRKAAGLIRDGSYSFGCSAIAIAAPEYDLATELKEYIKPFWNHSNSSESLGLSLLEHTGTSWKPKMYEFFRVAREKMLLAAADAMEKGLEP